MDIKRTRSVSLHFLVLFSGAYSAFIPPFLQNKAVMTGTAGVILNCTSTISDLRALQWSFTPVGGSNVLIFGDPNTPYAIEQPTGTQQKNLIVKAANESMAGTYYCIESTPGGATSSAQLIVVISNSSCSSNASTGLLQNQTVQMSCSFKYVTNPGLVNASMLWSNGTRLNNSLPVSSPFPSYSVSLANQTTAISTNDQQTGYWTPFMYWCNTTFTMNAASLPSGAATNQPDYYYISSPFSSPIPVTYFNPGSLGIIGVNPDGSVDMGATVTCWVDANPQASYSWSNGSTTQNVSRIQIGQTGTYTCTAWNIAGSNSTSTNVTKVLTTTSTTTVTTITSTTTVTSQASNSTGGGVNNAALIGGIVGGVGGAIVIALIAVLVYCLCFKNGGKNCPCCKRGTGSKYTNKEDRNDLNLKPVKEPPPYSGQVGPQRQSHPDVVDYAGSEYSHAGYPNQRPMFGDEGLNYAQIQLDNNPRSRMPLQVPENGNYADVRLA